MGGTKISRNKPENEHRAIRSGNLDFYKMRGSIVNSRGGGGSRRSIVRGVADVSLPSSMLVISRAPTLDASARKEQP
jgi:hypothetical protein